MAVRAGRASLDSQGPLAPKTLRLVRVYTSKHSKPWAALLTRSPGRTLSDPAMGFFTTQVWYREDVSHPNPEGSSWSLVDTPGEAVQISCGPHDLLWVTLWEGQALVREGINRNNPKGGQPYAPYRERQGTPSFSPALLLMGAARSFFWGWVGSSWSIVEPPASENGIVHVSVGVSVVWAITKDRKVRWGPWGLGTRALFNFFTSFVSYS